MQQLHSLTLVYQSNGVYLYSKLIFIINNKSVVIALGISRSLTIHIYMGLFILDLYLVRALVRAFVIALVLSIVKNSAD